MNFKMFSQKILSDSALSECCVSVADEIEIPSNAGGIKRTVDGNQNSNRLHSFLIC